MTTRLDHEPSASSFLPRIEDDSSTRLSPDRGPRTPSLEEIFSSILDLASHVVPLRALALVPCRAREALQIWCAHPDELRVARAEAAEVASVVALGGPDVALMRAMHTLPWIAVPVRGDGCEPAAVLAFAAERGLVHESAIGFFDHLARHLECLLGARLGADRGQRMSDIFFRETPGLAPERLAEITTDLLGSLDYRASLGRLVRVIGTEIAAGCVVELSDGRPARFAFTPTFDDAELASALSPLLRRVVASACCVRPNDSEAVDAARRLEVDELLVVPIRGAGALLGTLSMIGAPHRPLSVTTSDAEELGRRAATAIENGRRYESATDAANAHGDVLSNVSHELKNPLGVILLTAGRLLDRCPAELSSETKTALETIRRSAQRMRRLVLDLVEITTIDGAGPGVRPERCSAAPLLRDVVSAMEPLARSRSLELLVVHEESLPPLWVDPDRLVQILTNLVDNAIKFTDAGGTISVSARAVDEAVAFCVADTGIGIEPAAIPRVFDRFWQSPGTKRSGSGLGLSICKSLVERSGGRIEIRSEVGSGTVVELTIPCPLD